MQLNNKNLGTVLSSKEMKQVVGGGSSTLWKCTWASGFSNHVCWNVNPDPNCDGGGPATCVVIGTCSNPACQ